MVKVGFEAPIGGYVDDEGAIVVPELGENAGCVTIVRDLSVKEMRTRVRKKKEKTYLKILIIREIPRYIARFQIFGVVLR